MKIEELTEKIAELAESSKGCTKALDDMAKGIASLAMKESPKPSSLVESFTQRRRADALARGTFELASAAIDAADPEANPGDAEFHNSAGFYFFAVACPDDKEKFTKAARVCAWAGFAKRGQTPCHCDGCGEVRCVEESCTICETLEADRQRRRELWGDDAPN